jgi:NitT/TauT family transport system ATP-binding protein
LNIEITDLSVKYENERKEVPAIDGLNLCVDSGEICSLIGPSGCGKTTLLYTLSGIIKNYSGKALLGGAPADPKCHRIGLVTQNYGLLEWANVYANAVLGAEIKGIKTEKQAIASFLSKIGLAGLEKEYPCSLSGGQRQRVSLARAFLMKPDVLLMDEPFSALDAITRENMQNVFLDVWSKYSPTVIFVTHSIEEAVFLGQRIAIMSASPGHIEQLITNPLFGIGEIRTSESYYDFILAIRKNVEALWKAC